MLKIFLIMLLIFFGYIYFFGNKQKHIESGNIHEKDVCLNSQYPRISDLCKILDALVLYQEKFHQYPRRDQWHYKGQDGKWLEELVPGFLTVAPIEIRKNDFYYHQYMYKSDGANFKLIVGYPDDCESVSAAHPRLIVPIGDCVGYGFWSSKNASFW